ncbi:hypothetical protein SAMN05421736_104108 [Evansella caseinilytica]|uniref:Uncharacterized protein n=1 Tax=Evansella caseinilytica TaxID=1503961 RepID=A0A1H3NK38_9BACI|nr:hypothetical protein SAMN05421736_104108 [Evansella caseinilytica]
MFVSTENPRYKFQHSFCRCLLKTADKPEVSQEAVRNRTWLLPAQRHSSTPLYPDFLNILYK